MNKSVIGIALLGAMASTSVMAGPGTSNAGWGRDGGTEIAPSLSVGTSNAGGSRANGVELASSDSVGTSNAGWGREYGVVQPIGDDDNDGVNNNLDRCPGTGAGVAVNASGCALDSDGDGVVNYADRCPGTAPGVAVDATGCEPQVTTIKPAEVRVLNGVNFATASTRLTAKSKRILDEVVAEFAGRSFSHMEVGGHTDSRNVRGLNQQLSEGRANAVRNYLISRGLPGAKISAAGYASSQPVATNDTAAGRAENRRVELVVTSN